MATNLPELIMALTPLAMGVSMMNSTPTAMVVDLTNSHERAQALSLMRTMGDIGLLLGAGASGLLAHFTSIEIALQVNSAVMGSGMLWFA
eukprot:gene36978-45613_t